MSALPEITVAMSMHNASRFLRECIDSVLAQSFADFEFLIVDDGSSDGSADIVRSYADPRIRLICRPHDFIASLNTLLTEALGRYIARMDADDVMMPDRLRIQYDYLESHPEVAAVSAGAVKIDDAGNPIGRITTGDSGAPVAVDPRRMCEFNQVCNPASMIRRSVIDNLGLRYDPEFQVASDYRFWCDLLMSGAAIYLLPFDAIRYRISAGQISTARSDESEASARRIRRDLTMQLVAEANPGYTRDPVIESSGHELTLIIPFLNEGDEVENTVRSFFDHGGAGRVDIIVINDCSYDSYPYMERLTAIPGVTYILNRERLGVAASRDKGVSLCRTPYFLLLDAHMRAYDNLWVTEIPRLLRENDRRILCCQTRFLTHDESGNVIDDDRSPQSYGARLIFREGTPMPGIEWISEEQTPDRKIETIPAVYGAAYAASTVYWSHIGGLHGLREYGYDEQLLSLKTYLDGGSCVLLKNIQLGHIYRDRMPYRVSHNTSIYNSLFITETLFPPKERCKARASAYLYNRNRFIDSFVELNNYLDTNPTVKNTVKSADRAMSRIKKMNRTATMLERSLINDISSRIDDIADYVMSTKPDGCGLFHGTAGFAVWLYLYYRYSGNKKAAEIARDYIRIIPENIDPGDLTFQTGLSGIGWAVSYLAHMGLSDVNNIFLDSIINTISSRIESEANNSDDNSLRSGRAGWLAFMCSIFEKISDSSTLAATDKIAYGIMNDPAVGAKEYFYSFLWMQRRKDNPGNQFYLPALSDWIRPTGFIPKDNKYWSLSLYDGVLANSSLCFEL